MSAATLATVPPGYLLDVAPGAVVRVGPWGLAGTVAGKAGPLDGIGGNRPALSQLDRLAGILSNGSKLATSISG